MAATSGYCCNASEPGRGGNARGEGWGERKPVANAWPEPSLISRGAHPALPPGLPPPPGLACPVEGAAVYPAPPLPAWGSVERLYDGRPWNRQQQDRPPAYAISDSSGRIYEETVWHEHQQNCCFIDIPCGARGIPTTNFPEKMYGGTAKNRRLQNGRTSYAAPNPQDRTNRARSPRRCQNGDFVSLAPTTHDRLPRRGTERRFENGARTDMSHRNNRNERRGQDCRLQNGYRSASEAIFEGRPRQRHHRDGLPALRDVEAPGTYGYGGAMYPAARLCIGERDAPSDCTAVSCPPGALLDPTFAPPMCGVRRSRLPCDQYLPRFPPYSDFRAAAALTAAAVTLNGSGYLCPGAQPFGKGNARNGPTQPPNRSLNSPQVLKPAEGVPVVIRNEDGTICRCIRAEKWKQPGGLPRKRASTADDLDLHVSFSERDESRLETQIQELVRRLTPDDGWHAIRSFFLAKLRNVLTRSEHTDIEVFMFGSTVSGLATADSDADVYVRTGRGSMTVHNIAALLQRGGMEQIIVIDAAKVQIVKFQDTEFGIKCDINVDGKLALVNTRLVKSYVAIDWRVRAFIITVKHWAKRRGLNAAAEKTLSSYAWSCLCINHLQTRNPPVLPSLHVLAQKRRANATLSPCTDTSAVSTDLDCRPRSPSPVSTASELDEGEEKEAEDFLSDLGDPELVGFRGKNTESVAGLLCSFFRTMAYEFDYHNTVVSVRHGTQIPKTEKGWNVGGCNVGRGRPYRVLAIEDPINIRRNLANSADETAVAGLRCEFRRAWKVLCQTGSLAEVCDPWRSQTTEPRVQEHASWLARFSQEEVLADVEDFRRTQPAPRSVSSLSDRSTCSTGSESRRTSICEEPTPPTSAACSSPATYHRPEKAVAEEEINRPVQGISAIDPTPPPVKIASQKAAESQIAVAGEVGVSQPVGHVTQTPGPVGETHSTGFVAEERAEAANSCHRSLNATTLAPGLPVTRTTNDCGKSRSCNAERRPNGQPSPLAQVYEHEWPTLAEAGTRSRRNRRCPRMASSPPAKPAPSNVTSCDAVPSSQSIIPAAPGGTSVDAPKKALLGIGRGMPFPQVKNTLAPQSASRIPRQQHLRGPAPAASAETAKQERLSTTRCPSPAWAKLPIVAPAPSGHNASEWPTLAASRGGGKSKRRS